MSTVSFTVKEQDIVDHLVTNERLRACSKNGGDPMNYSPTHRYCFVCDALVVLREKPIWPEEHDLRLHLVVEIQPPPGLTLAEIWDFARRIFAFHLTNGLLGLVGHSAVDSSNLPRRILCRSCQQTWWDDEECLCTCTDDQELPYEDWIVVEVGD